MDIERAVAALAVAFFASIIIYSTVFPDDRNGRPLVEYILQTKASDWLIAAGMLLVLIYVENHILFGERTRSDEPCIYYGRESPNC